MIVKQGLPEILYSTLTKSSIIQDLSLRILLMVFIRFPLFANSISAFSSSMKTVTTFCSQCVTRKAKYTIRTKELACVILPGISSRMFTHTINHHQNLGDCSCVTGILMTAKINDFFSSVVYVS